MQLSHNHPLPILKPGRRLSKQAIIDLAIRCGADDAGVVSVDLPELAAQRTEAHALWPKARSFIAFVVRMNREPIRTPARSVSNTEFHATGDEVNDTARRIVTALEDAGVHALNPPMGFPMEMAGWPGKVWTLSHKPIAEAAGMGRMGIHRCVIHPRFGSFILLGTVLTDADIDEPTTRLDDNPCVTCKLCVAACPTGAIKPDGAFDFASCYTHNYREFMGGFADWIDHLADSPSAAAFRGRIPDHETVSMWQSLAFGPNYKAAYCIAVCPAGSDVMSPFRENKKEFIQSIVAPLQDKRETVYVVAKSDAADHVAKRFPHKAIKHVHPGLRPVSVQGFLQALPHIFQRGQAGTLDARYHFRFRGGESVEATIDIRGGRLTIREGLHDAPDLTVTADAGAWIRFVRHEASIVWLLLSRKVRLKGRFRLLLAFGRCFPA